MMRAIAASGAVSIDVSIMGMSKPSSIAVIFGLISAPPSSTPRMIEPTVVPSIQPLAIDELLRRQELGQNAVLGRRVGGGTEADDRVGDKRMHREQHQRAADDLDRVGDQHHATLGHRVGEGADERREDDIRDDEALLQRRGHPCRLVQLAQERDGGDQERIVGERRKELRRHDGVKAGFHLSRRDRRFGRHEAAAARARPLSWYACRAGPFYTMIGLRSQSDSSRGGARTACSAHGVAPPLRSPILSRMARPLFAQVNLAALAANVALARQRAPGAQLLAVVKADAYGHGLLRVLPALDEADGLALLELDMAVALREHHYTRRILLHRRLLRRARAA